MKLKIIKYAVLGLLCGCFADVIFSLFVSLRMNTGKFYLVLPALVNDYANELNATIIQIVMFCWLGMAAGAAYWFSENVELPIWKQICGYVVTLTLGMIPAAFVGHWFTHPFIGIFSYIVILLCITFVLFIIGWFNLNNEIKKIKNAIVLQKEGI